MTIDALKAPVRVVRDRWGVPHIYAQSQDDLFVAQGVVQAQDRLFQMDLWRRSAQGRLAEVLGANFIERDAATRRVQYRGDLRREWSSYGTDAERIADAFTRGVNAWVALARERPPEPFRAAGWIPDYWTATDVLNRTDAFLAVRDAAAILQRVDNGVVADVIGRVGAPPFFSLLATQARDDGQPPGDRELIAADAVQVFASPEAVVRNGVLTTAETWPRLEAPSRRYLVHLVAPGWNVIGATAPWRPGVAVGHNDRLAWGTVPTASADAIDILEEPIDAVTGTPFTDRVNVRGRAEPFTFETQVTPHGIVIATDANRGRVFTLRWAGAAAGCAPELAALTLDRAGTFDQMRAAVATWRMPPVRFSVSDAVSSQSMGDDHGRPRESSARGPSRALFASPLGITDAARRRFDVGPIARPDRDQPFQAGFDPRAWDDSHVVNAPGQSETPDSAHFADLARLWSAGEMFPLAFSESAVQAAADTTLMLLPAGARRSP